MQQKCLRFLTLKISKVLNLYQMECRSECYRPVVFIEFSNLQVVKYNENKHGEKFSLLELLECDRKELRKHDLSNFYRSAHDVWAVD